MVSRTPLLEILVVLGMFILAPVLLPAASQNVSDGEDLLKAALAGDLPRVRTLVEKGAEVDHQNRSGNTALIFASQRGHEGVVEALLAAGAEVDRQNNDGETPLMRAFYVSGGHEGVVEALLAVGADVNRQDRSGNTALIFASQRGHEGIVKTLLGSGADVNLRANNGVTALSMASKNGHEEIVKALREKQGHEEIVNQAVTFTTAIRTPVATQDEIDELTSRRIGARAEVRAEGARWVYSFRGSVTVPRFSASGEILTKNLGIFFASEGNQYGALYGRPGEIEFESYDDLLMFLGVDSIIQFDEADWVDFFGEEYRGGGFTVANTGIVFEEGTTTRIENNQVLSFEGGQWVE